MHISQIKKTRDELFELKLARAHLEKKTNTNLNDGIKFSYEEEIFKLKKQIEAVKKKMVRQKMELYNENSKKTDGRSK